jgi:hypothetical protein
VSAPRHGVFLPRLLGALVLAHVAWGLARVPTRVVARRLDEVEQFRRSGAIDHFLATRHLQGADAVAWVRDRTGPDAVVLWAGDAGGALEFAPAMLAPRLLVDERSCAHGQTTYAGRPIATGTLGATTGRIVLVGNGKSIAAEVR